MTEKNYAPWDANPSTHHSVAAFGEALRSEVVSGVHVVSADSRTTIDVLISGDPGADGRAVPVFLNGAVPVREDKTGPFFSGVRVGMQVAAGFVSISDPSVDRDRNLSLAWYGGNQYSSTRQAVVSVIETLSRSLNAELVLTGGSGGGFASLFYAAKCEGRISAFVWNPQTSILAYNRKFVDAYLHSAYPDSLGEAPADDEWLEQREVECRNAGLDFSVTDPATHDPGKIHRLLVLQNQLDWHLASHAVPYIKGHSFQAMGTGSYVVDNDHVVQVATWGDGHAPLPFDLVVENLREFLAGKSAVLSIGRGVATGASSSPETLYKAPQDLRAISTYLNECMAAQHIASTNHVSITVQDPRILPGYGGLKFGVVQHHEDTRHQLTRYVEDRVITFEPEKLLEGMNLLVNVQDGMNHSVTDVPVSLVKADNGRPPSDKQPVFIYGSCVTRDAFALTRAPGVADYVARSAIISAMNQPPEVLPEGFSPSNLSSAFQRRMVEWDIKKQLLSRLGEAYHGLVVIDLIDERLAVAKVNGGFVTQSSEATNAGLRIDDEDLMKISDPNFMKEWTLAARKLTEHLAGERVVINRVFWAREDQNGVDLRERFSVEINNKILEEMYDFLESNMTCEVIRYPEDLLVADSHHHWGLSPFHFTHDMYEYFIDRLEELNA